MKRKWLNLVLRLTNRIYSIKQRIIGMEGLGVVKEIIALIFLEIILGVVSLPLYFTLKSAGVTAYLEEKGGYAKISFDYNLRRVLTLTGTAVILIIWLLKLALIMGAPKVYGPLELYSVSPLQPTDILTQEMIQTETRIQIAEMSSSIPRPELKQVKKLSGGDYSFSGIGQPLSTVVLLLSDAQTAIYYSQVDKNGQWQIDHSQKKFKLSEGNHLVIVFGYDEKTEMRSEASATQYFKVTTTWNDRLMKDVDVLANWSVILIIVAGIFLTFLTL